MKKLMIAAAIVCAAVMAQASAVTWSSGAVYFNGDGSLAQSGGSKVAKKASLYLYHFADEAAYNTAYATIAKQDASTATWAKDYIADTKNVAVATGTTTAYSKISLDDSGNAGETIYGVVIAKYTDASNKDYYFANAATYLVGPSDGTILNLQETLGGDTISPASEIQIKWNAAQAVPEPTSGLLLLLGVAGLALRRRRA